MYCIAKNRDEAFKLFKRHTECWKTHKVHIKPLKLNPWTHKKDTKLPKGYRWYTVYCGERK